VCRQIRWSRGRFEMEGEDTLAHWALVLRFAAAGKDRTDLTRVSLLFTHWVLGLSCLARDSTP
jgi:hypothetical protein